ncbi:MAG: hypothetical protein WA133_13905 [Syntrophales bacterium]
MDKNEIPSGIRVDKEGVWHYQGAAMFRKDIWQEFYRHLKQEESGRYLVELGEERAYVEVEDTPYVIKSASFACKEGGGEEVVYLDMPDDSREVLDPSSLHVGEGNTLYGALAGRGIVARFSRAAYYQIAQHIEHDAGRDSYFVSLNNRHYYIK